MRPQVKRAPLRRDLLRGAATAAAATALAPVLSACAGSSAQRSASSASAAQPTVSNPAIVLNFAPNWQGAGWNKTAQQLNQEFFDANYSPSNPGVRVNVVADMQGAASSQVVASIAGSGFMDVFQDCCDDLVVWYNSGFLTPLDDYIRKDNVDLTAWSKGHIQVLTFNGKLMALPAYDGPCVIFYRQDLLDSLGLPYPDPNWTYQDATQLWLQCVGKNKSGHQRFGCSVFNSGWYENLNWWIHGWGGAEMTDDRKTALLDSAQALAMATYIQTNAQNKALTGRSDVSVLVNETCVFKQSGGWELLPAATSLGTRFKWDILPVPKWPAGRATFLNIDFYGMNAASKHPEHAWNLLKYVTYEPDYPRFQMQATLVQPCLLSLYDQWEQSVVATAPPLQGKQINWYKDALTGGYAWPNLFFEFGALQVDSLINNWLNQVWAGQTSPETAMRQLNDQINAIQQTGATSAQAAQAATSKFPTAGKDIAAVPTGI
jgi:multiple sugar transport system substrate-binding protein